MSKKSKKFSLIELLVSIIAFSMVGSGLVAITQLTEDSFDLGLSYTENSRSGRATCQELSKKIRHIKKQIYPKFLDTTASFTVFEFGITSQTTSTGKIYLKSNGDLLFENSFATPPYNLESPPGFSSQILGQNLHSFAIGFSREDLASFTFSHILDTSKPKINALYVHSRVHLRCQ